MRLELPFKLSRVEAVDDDISSYKVFFYKNKLFVELISKGKVVQVIPLNGSMVQLPKCRKDRWWVRGPSAIYYTKSSRFSSSLRFCWRNSCLCESSDNVKVVSVFDYFDSVALIYRRGREYYAIIDDLSGFTSTWIASEKPRRILFRNGVLLLVFKDYIRILSPSTGLIDAALTEEIEPLGVDLARGPSSVMLYSKSSKILFSLSRASGVEPLASCDDVISIRDVRGSSLVLCDFEPINGTFYPFYAGKIFVDTFSYTDNFNIINPYILSFIENNNKKYFVAAIIASSPIYITILRREGIDIKKVMTPADLRNIEKIVLRSIERMFGPVNLDDSPSDVNALIYSAGQNTICLGTRCGKCIIHVNGLDVSEERITLRIGTKSYEPSHVFGSEAVFVINDNSVCEDNMFENLELCYNDKCVSITAKSKTHIDAQLICKPLRFSDIDTVIAKCRILGSVSRVIRYSPCIFVPEDNNSIKVYVNKENKCIIGLVTPQGHVIRQNIDYEQLAGPLVKEVPQLISVKPVGIQNYSLFIDFSYERSGIIPISINDVFIPVEANNVVLRLSGDSNIRIGDGTSVRNINIRLPRRGAIVTRLNDGLLRIECVSAHCTMFCGSNILYGNTIDIDPIQASIPQCDVVVMSRGTTQVQKISPIIEAVKLGVLTGLRLLQAL